MRFPLADWTRRERMLLAVCAAALALSIASLLGGRGISAAQVRDLVNTKEIQNNTIRSADVGKGKLLASDLLIYVNEGQQVLVPGGGAITTATAQCAGNDQLIGGGGSLLGVAPGLIEVGSEPSINQNPDQWRYSAVNYGAPPGAGAVAEAICMRD